MAWGREGEDTPHDQHLIGEWGGGGEGEGGD